jgi:hypothetical protein
VSAVPGGAARDETRVGGSLMGRRLMRGVLVVADGFVALTAVAGGLALAIGAEATRFPAAWLVGTPFHSYVVPGLILAVVVGGSATLATAATLRRWPAAPRASVLAGAITMGWIVGEVLILNQPSAPTSTEVFYVAVGFVMATLGLALERTGRRDDALRNGEDWISAIAGPAPRKAVT